MSKHDYSQYKPEIGDKVYANDKKAIVTMLKRHDGEVVEVNCCALTGSSINGIPKEKLKLRGKTKRKFLERSKQGKFAEPSQADPWEGAKFARDIHNNVGIVRGVYSNTVLIQGGDVWQKMVCKPIKPSDMNPLQMLSIVRSIE